MQFLLILAVFILLCGLLFLVIRWPQGKHVTFSGHAAKYQHTIIYYNLLFTAVLPLLVIFFAAWFVPTFQLSSYFLVFLIVSCVLQYIVTIIPRVGSWKTKYHDLLASLSAILLMPPIAFIVFAHEVHLVGRIGAFFAFMMMLSIIMFVLVKRGSVQYSLLLQAAYFGAFFVAVLIATYL